MVLLHKVSHQVSHLVRVRYVARVKFHTLVRKHSQINLVPLDEFREVTGMLVPPKLNHPKVFQSNVDGYNVHPY